jgi:probable rRNA maturation factor
MKVSVTRTVRAGWLPPARELRGWAAAALGRRAGAQELSVLLAGRARSRALNARFRGRDPVMPSAAAQTGLLGELVICPAVLRAEARAQHKSARAHWAHMVVHGVLHLVGYDHEIPEQARRMERREIRTLRRLGFANPYRTER